MRGGESIKKEAYKYFFGISFVYAKMVATFRKLMNLFLVAPVV
jgi:hypothetical protein